jgi:nicastrin
MQMNSDMAAAKDSQTCMRRSTTTTNLNPVGFCDPLGDKNIVGTIKAVFTNTTRPADSVIVVGTRVSGTI